MSEAEQIAREKNFYLWRLSWNGRTRKPKSGRFEISGPLPPECLKELSELVRRWTEEGLL